MRSLGGFVLLAGIGVGLFVYFPAPVDRSTTLEQATRALADPDGDEPRAIPVTSPSPAGPSRLASFSPDVSLAEAQRGEPLAAPANLEAVASWQTTTAPTAGALEPNDPDSRYKLVSDIQQQLKRVGCYWGRVNGSWNTSTREAMREFTSRSNAALPVEKPDYLLLTLLKSHNGRSCGAPDSSVAAAPAEVLPWKASGAGQPQASRLFTPVPTSVVTTEPLPGRMSIGAPMLPAAQEPLVPAASPSQQSGVSTAALDQGSASPGTASSPSKPRPSKKSSKSYRPSPGTPRYNLMLSLGGVY